MGSSALGLFSRRSAGSFIRTARSRGVRARVARILESAAWEISPEGPERILNSRELFERAAMRAVVGDVGNLELSFGLVDVLASTVETLGLARSSDVPDPFRRVWISSESGTRRRGVVLRCEGGEIAVFCSTVGDPISGVGSVLNLSYRGFSSPVEYGLRLDDAVRLPGALVLHLTRLDSLGAIGRTQPRLGVHIHAQVRALQPNEDENGGEPTPCEILDISSGGLCMVCTTTYDTGQEVCLELSLPDDSEEPLSAHAIVCWSRQDTEGRCSHGLLLIDLPELPMERLQRFLNAAGVELDMGREDQRLRLTDVRPQTEVGTELLRKFIDAMQRYEEAVTEHGVSAVRVRTK